MNALNGQQINSLIKSCVDEKALNSIIVNFNMNAKTKPREINKMLLLNEKFKKLFGEVFTPIPLVEEMLDKLPKEVWKDKNLKWVDPSCGTCNFLLVIKERLMESLIDIIDDKEEREKWILEHMLYGVDIQERNVVLSKLRLDPYNKYKLHIEMHDSFDFDFWGLTFDIIAGNPPYGDHETNKKGNLWSKFVALFFGDILKENGFLCFITPPSWMAGTNENGNEKKKNLHNIFSQNDVIYLSLDAKKHFDVGSQFSAYVIRKSRTETLKTHILSNSVVSHIDIKNFLFLPKMLTNESLSIVNKLFNKNIPKKPFISQWCVGYPKPENQEQYPIYNCGGKFASSHVEPKNSKIKKVIFSVAGSINVKYDDGIYGTSINSYWMEVKNEKEANIYIDAINSKLFRFVLEQCKYSGFHNILLLKNFPRIGDHQNLYEYFDLSKKEIELVERYVK